MTAYPYIMRKRSRTKVDQDLTVPVNVYPYGGLRFLGEGLIERPGIS
jgi:hypothetical protein